jgi:hypothetical protein
MVDFNTGAHASHKAFFVGLPNRHTKSTMEEESPPSRSPEVQRHLEIVGLHASNNGRSCSVLHSCCGDFLKVGDLLRLQKCVMTTNGKLHDAIKCVHIIDGADSCTAAFVPRSMVKNVIHFLWYFDSGGRFNPLNTLLHINLIQYNWLGSYFLYFNHYQVVKKRRKKVALPIPVSHFVHFFQIHDFVHINYLFVIITFINNFLLFTISFFFITKCYYSPPCVQNHAGIDCFPCVPSPVCHVLSVRLRRV